MADLETSHATIDHTGITGVGGGGGIPAVLTSRAVQVGGDITLNTTSTLEVAAATGGPGTGALDLTIAAATGDIIEFGWLFWFGSGTAVAVAWDVATWVSGAAVNWLGHSAGDLSLADGLFYWQASAVGTAVGSAAYVVQAGDITGGNVVLRLFYRAAGARVCGRSTGTGPLILSLKNFG